jgi:hypothetical protein
VPSIQTLERARAGNPPAVVVAFAVDTLVVERHDYSLSGYIDDLEGTNSLLKNAV